MMNFFYIRWIKGFLSSKRRIMNSNLIGKKISSAGTIEVETRLIRGLYYGLRDNEKTL
jgi:hypothetical protein